MDDESGSLKILRTKDWLKLKSSRLFILYFSDPRSHWVYRKSQYYQGGMRCCLMAYLLKVLSDALQSNQLLSHIHIWPKPKAKIGHTDSFYPAPPSSDVIATATNPRQIGLTDRDLGLTEMGLQTLCYLLQYFRSYRYMQSAPPSLLGQLSVSLITQIGPTEFE